MSSEQLEQESLIRREWPKRKQSENGETTMVTSGQRFTLEAVAHG
jgi:hypothetical protein